RGSTCRRWDRSCSCMYLLPAGLGHSGNFAAHCHFTQFVTGQTELAENTARTAGDHAAITLTGRARVAGQLLQGQTSLVTLFVSLGLIVDDRLQGLTLGSVFFGQLSALDIAIDEGKFCHVIAP